MLILEFLVKRIAQGVLIVVLTSLIIFTLLRVVPGDPVRLIVGGMAPDNVVEEVASKMGLRDPYVTLAQPVAPEFTYFIVYGKAVHEIDATAISSEEVAVADLRQEEIDAEIAKRFGRRLVVLGCALESDAHTVGIDAIFNPKGFAGDYGLERYAGLQSPPTASDTEAWIAALGQAQDRAGLLACDDFHAASRVLARLNGEELAVTAEGAVALGAVPGGTELIRYYLSDDYHRVRAALDEPVRV